MINLPDSFFEGTAAVHVTLEQFIDLLAKFETDTIPVWNPPALTKWAKERNKDDGSFYVYWDLGDQAVSCFSINYWDLDKYFIYEHDDLVIIDPEQTSEIQSILELLE